MSYYMRFLLEDDRPLSLDMILAGLRAVDPGFALSGDGERRRLTRAGELLADLEINLAGGGLFEEEINEFRERVEPSGRAGLAARLSSVTAIVAARLFWQDRGAEKTLDLLDPPWDWLTASRHGLLQADGEGFYDEGYLILDLN